MHSALFLLVLSTVLQLGLGAMEMISRGKKALSSASIAHFPARFGNDDDLDTLASTLPNMQSLGVDLDGRYPIDTIVIYNRADEFSGRIVGVIVELITKRNGILFTCATITEDKPVYNISCQNKFAERVRLRHTRAEMVQFAELEVYSEGVNTIVSSMKPTAQSSSLQYFPSYNCVDKDPFTLCSTQLSNKPWWAVDLDGQYTVEQVQIYNSPFGNSTVGAIIDLLDANDNVTHSCGTISTDQINYYIPCGNNLAEKVRIRLPRRDVLSIAELEVVGVLAPQESS